MLILHSKAPGYGISCPPDDVVQDIDALIQAAEEESK